MHMNVYESLRGNELNELIRSPLIYLYPQARY